MCAYYEWIVNKRDDFLIIIIKYYFRYCEAQSGNQARLKFWDFFLASHPMVGSVVANCLYDWIEFDFNCRKVCREKSREKSSKRTDKDNLLDSRFGVIRIRML